MSDSIKQQGFDTLKIHAGYNPSEHQGSIQVPIYQTTAFEVGSPERVERLLRFEEFGLLYTRVGNPTQAALEQRIAALDGGVAAVSLASGSGQIQLAGWTASALRGESVYAGR